MTTRREFLSNITHRIRFVYLPKHSSWLNQIEIFFGITHRKCLRGGNFTSVARPRISTPTVHHLLQHDDGPSVRLDLHRQASSEERDAPGSSRLTGVLRCKDQTNHKASPSDETPFPSCGTSVGTVAIFEMSMAESSGSLYYVLQRSYLAGWNLGSSKSLDELPATQAGDLGACPLRNQAAVVELDCGHTTDLSPEVLRTFAEILQERVRYVDCDGDDRSCHTSLYRQQVADHTSVR